LEIAHERRERKFIKLTLGVLFALVLFIFGCWGAYRFYSQWEQGHLVRRALGFLSGGDVKDAALSAQRAWQIKPTAEAARAMAEISERAGDRGALDWRRQALRLSSGSAADVLLLVSAALKIDDVAAAEQGLEMVDPAQREAGAFHAAAARIAEAREHQAEAEKEWTRALQQAPTEKSFLLSAAMLRLKSPNEKTRAQGEQDLKSLRNDPVYRVRATRSLINYAINAKESPEEIRLLAKELQEYPEAEFNDHILYLSILRQMQHPDFISYLTSIERDSVNDPVHLGRLLSWMSTTGMALVAIDFAKTLSPEQRNKWPVPLGVAESYARVDDWNGLDRSLKQADWGSFEFLRHAFLARVYRAGDKPAAAAHEWAEAERIASNQPETVQLLSRTVYEWGWRTEAEDLLWTLTKFPQTKHSALQELYQRYSVALDSQGLHRVLSRLCENDPGNLKLQNNLAQISLLLGVNPDDARKMARDIHNKEPTNPAFASTYAYSLFAAGDAAGAVRIMSALPPEQLHDPSIGTYYGIFLASAGQEEKAGQFLQLAERARLLPEERQLVLKAKERIHL
jgi:hypothetical protein